MNGRIQVSLLSVLICGASHCSALAEPNGKQFRNACGQKAAAATEANAMAVVGQDGWLFLTSELRHLSVGKFTGDAAQAVSKAKKPEWRDPLPAILDFKAGLDRAGIELLMVPVPPKAIVYPEMLGDERLADKTVAPPRLDAIHQEFYEALRAKGVTVLDLFPAFAEARFHENGAVYCKQDSHWSGRGCEIAAHQIANLLKDRAWLESANRQTFDSEVRDIEISGDLMGAANETKTGKEALPLRVIGKKDGGTLQPIETDKASPVILLGDSHTLVFQAGEDMHARGAGLADQLAFELGFPVDLIGVRGSGATPARINFYRRIRGDSTYLQNKKLVIWCFTAREFTEAASGWRKVPVVK